MSSNYFEPTRIAGNQILIRTEMLEIHKGETLEVKPEDTLKHILKSNVIL